MGATINYPDGTSLTSTALTLEEINNILQPLTLGMLGKAVSPSSPLVRIEYPTEGAPFQEVGDDVCYLRCLEKGGEYEKIRERENSPAPDPNVLETWSYTRIWGIRWCCYGPNSFDNVRAIRSALFQDYFTNALELKQLFPVSDFPSPVRAPEQINAQWIERVDLEIEMYEFVQETIKRQTILSSEVILEGESGIIADVTVTVS